VSQLEVGWTPTEFKDWFGTSIRLDLLEQSFQRTGLLIGETIGHDTGVKSGVIVFRVSEVLGAASGAGALELPETRKTASDEANIILFRLTGLLQIGIYWYNCYCSQNKVNHVIPLPKSETIVLCLVTTETPGNQHLLYPTIYPIYNTVR
jgi:hypothetical protein